MSRRLAAASGLALSLLVAHAAQATTPLLGFTSLGVLAKANAAQQDDLFDSQTWSNIGAHPNGPKDLGTLALDPHARTANGNIDVSAHAELFAHWDSADAGHVTTAISRTIDVGTGNARQLGLLVNADWEYHFTADEDGTFNLGYQFTSDGGDLTGLADWVFEIRGPGRFDDTDLVRSFGDLHTLSVALTAGETYTVSLFDLDANQPADGKHLDGGYRARFDWSIAPAAVAGVPEPSAWALMLVGLGLTGAAARQRRLAA